MLFRLNHSGLFSHKGYTLVHPLSIIHTYNLKTSRRILWMGCFRGYRAKSILAAFANAVAVRSEELNETQ